MNTTTITVTILATTETLPATTPAMRSGRFDRLFRAYHAPIGSIEAPAEVHTAPLWAGPDGAEAHEALCAELLDEASTLDAMPAGETCYVLLAGQGYGGCDVWAAAVPAA